VFLRLKAQSCEAQTAAGSISYSLSRSPRRKILTIYVKDDQRVCVLAPLFLSDQKIQHFVQRKAQWIVKHLNRFQSRFPQTARHGYRDGEEFLFLGQGYRLCYVPSELKRMKMELSVSGFEACVPLCMPHDQIEEKIKKAFFVWYRNQARKIVGERLPFWAQKLDVDIQKVVVRSQKRIWGSCYYRQKRININWKIAMLPLEVIDYIIVHELCHFYVPNHSKRFWAKVKSFFPHYESSEQWLQEHEALTRLH
jgi:predicted metal-dependent hydrolase